jgi:zinc/manganese transport system permease protein
VLFLALYPGRSANKFGLLTGQIVAVDDPQLLWMLGVSVLVMIALAIMWRPLMFATVDPDIAAARGVPVRALSPIFMIVLGLTVAMAVQVVGALLVLALLVTPAAAAMRMTASALWVPVLSVAFGTVSVVGGILIALGGSLPISPYVTTISFAIYVICRIAGNRKMRRGWAPRRRLPVNQDAVNQDAGKQQNGRTTPVETGVVRPS